MKIQTKKYLFYIFLLFQPIIDLITSIMTKYLDTPFTLGVLIRGFIFIAGMIYILFFSKSKYKKISSIYLLTLLLYFILYFVTKPSIIFNKQFLISELIYIFKYYYFIIVFLLLLNFFQEFRPNNRKIFKCLQIALCIYCFIIFLANITGTAFGTYENGAGNTGWFYSGNEIGIIITLLFPLLFIIINKADSFKCLIYVIPIVLAIEQIGTKTSMLGLLLTTFVFCIYYLFRILNGKYKQFFITLIMLLIICFSFVKLPVLTNVKNTVDRFETRQKDKAENQKNNVEDAEKNSKYSDNFLTTVILNDRDYYNNQISEIYNRESLIDKFFGIGFSNRDEINNKNIEKLIEMDFNDIFYRYGIIGFILYIAPILAFLGCTMLMIIKLKFKLNLKQLLLCYICFTAVCISIVVGHTLGAPAVSIYIAIFMVLTMYYLKNNSHKVLLKKDTITILALHLGTGGIEKYLSSLVKMLYKNYKIEIISTYKVSDTPAFDFSKNVKITYLINDYPRKKEIKFYIKNKKLLKTLLLGINFFKLIILKYYRNIVAVEEINSKYIITTRAFHNKIVSNNKNRDIIAIATEHNYHNNNNKYIRNLVDSCKNINYLVLVSEELKNFYSNKMKNTKCVYIPNVIDSIPKYQKKKKVNYKLISVGRLSPEKGFDDLIDIISMIKNSIPDIGLDIYGDGLLFDTYNEKIKSLNLEKNIKLKGFCNHNEIMKNLKDYDLYVMTSFTESFGLVLIEAMSRSVPCIAFDSANGAKTLLSNGNGILISNRDKEKYTKMVVELLSNKDLLNEIGKNGYNSLSCYDINNVKKQWLDLLSEKN